ncbi:hypothetical protein [Haloechinothrix halophila]|uniref:hypothetical protein n=1 Tax=Haloechinothrix halophila TaxID=1069073 RepID=UPI00041D5011|nr:hypothetical protein [Haloechinothrix halophila]
MTEGKDPGTPPQDTGMPDDVETDPAALNSSEDLDEDRLKVDPLETGVEPPEQWSAAERYDRTPFEQEQGETLDERVRQEQPDTEVSEPPELSVSATPVSELDASVDDAAVAPEEPLVREQFDDEAPPGDAERRGQSADKAGGSVANALREPHDPPDTPKSPDRAEE